MTETTKASPQDVKRQLREMLDEIEGFRDTIKVRMHLAGMDLKQRWDHVDARFLKARDEIKSLREDARADLLAATRDGLYEIKKGLREVRDALDTKPH